VSSFAEILGLAGLLGLSLYILFDVRRLKASIKSGNEAVASVSHAHKVAIEELRASFSTHEDALKNHKWAIEQGSDKQKDLEVVLEDLFQSIELDRQTIQEEIKEYSGHTHQWNHQHKFRKLSEHEEGGKLFKVMECASCENREIREV
jgi:hypothetical protein